MSAQKFLSSQLRVSRSFAVRFLSLLVGIDGLYILASTLLAQIATHRGSRLSDFTVDIPLLVGISLIYLSTLLRRRKRTAWVVTVLAYAFYLGLGMSDLSLHYSSHMLRWHEVVRAIVLPLVILMLLFAFEKDFIVKSDIQGFRFAMRFVLIIFVVALVYGVTGFQLMDESDFHQEISLPTAVHYTVDQFNLTTNKPLKPYTRRAHLFDDSLSFVSLAAVIYAVVSLFQPLKARLSDQANDRDHVSELMKSYGASSEEFFKVWPHDKQYFFDDSRQAAIAFHVYRGVALCLSDPIGNPERFTELMANFQDLCFSNDWLPSLVHVADTYKNIYEQLGFSIQKLGQEAILDLDDFKQNVAKEKYFRQIGNRFNKQGYSYEMLTPPHHEAVLNRLEDISKEWLGRGGRAERGFVMGYYTPEYIQLCRVFVARDAAGTIQGFVNLVPADFNKQEATYDMLRHSNSSLGNINDYVLMGLVDQLKSEGYSTLNLGLCPLAGFDEDEAEQKTLIDNVLQFAYTNGDRFYSFSGLHRFKAKYRPEWHDRYIGYQGGVRGFSRTMTALTRTMKSVVKLPKH